MARTPQIRVRLERLKRSGFHARLGRRVVAASSLVGIVLFIPLAACRFVRADLEQAPTGEEGDRRAAGGPSPRDLFELPHGWKLTHDDGRREDNSRTWPRNIHTNTDRSAGRRLPFRP